MIDAMKRIRARIISRRFAVVIMAANDAVACGELTSELQAVVAALNDAKVSP